MSNRLNKKNTQKIQLPTQQETNLNTYLSIYDEHLDSLYRQLARKTDKIEWVTQSYPLISFDKISNIETPDAWLLPADNDRKKTITVDKDGSLSLVMDLVDGDSFYIQTGSMNINGLPLHKDYWCIKSSHKYRFNIEVQYGNSRPNCAMFIVQYDQEKRITHKFQQIYNGLNRIDFDTAPTACYFSIALRLTGKGSLSIKPINITAEEMLPINSINIDNCHNTKEIIRILELKAKVLTDSFEKHIHALPDSPLTQKNNVEQLKNKLAVALYEKQKIEKSLYYRLGKALSEAKRDKISGLLSLPQKLIKIRAAKRKGKFEHPPLNNSIKLSLLEQVGIFNEEINAQEITWPSFSSRARLRNQHINVVSISDKFTYECFRYEANFIPLTKKNWKEEIDAANPIFFFIESAWNGNDGEWTYTMASYKKKLGDPLRDAIKYCKSKNIPVVFWNKEDPTNYDIFIDVAADCDYIFTTDGGIINKYKTRVGHDRVYSLAFAAQPAIHNPIRDKRLNLPTYEICFAGSWYNNGHDTRRIQTEIVLDGSMQRELHIYDRMLHATKHRESRIFPAKYQPFIVGSLNYEQMVTAYRQYKLFLNINTVQDSPTMFSRRVFEILACATPVVSTNSEGMKAMLGEHIHIVDDKNTANKVVQQLLESDTDRERIGHLAARHCLKNHSYEQRFNQILNTIGIKFKDKKDDKVTIIMCTNRPKNIDLMIDNYLRQLHLNKELIIILNKDEFNIDEVKAKTNDIPNVQIHQLPESLTLGECLNYGVAHASGNYIAKMDDDDIYGANYLIDTLLAFNFSGADVVGKDSYYCYVESKDLMVLKHPGKDNRYSDFISGGTLVIRKEVFDKIKFHKRNRGEDTNFLKDCKDNGLSIYSSDKYNFIQMRYANNKLHTWKIADEEYLKTCQIVKSKLSKELSGI